MESNRNKRVNTKKRIYSKPKKNLACQSVKGNSKETQTSLEESENTDEEYEFSNNEVHTGPVTERIERKQTTWECYTIALKGLVNELITLGAKPKLRKVTFQLWSSYLKQERIVFFSENENEKPTLPITFKNSDAEVLYDIKNLRKIIYNDSITDKRFLTKGNENIANNNSGSDSSSGSDYTSHRRVSKLHHLKVNIPLRHTGQTNFNEILSDTTRGVRVTLKKSAHDVILKQKTVFQKQQAKHGVNIPLNMKHWIRKRKFANREKSDIKNVQVTVNTLLAIIRLALILIQDDIHLADLLRWACEGRVSVYQIMKFLPENAPIRDYDVVPCSRGNFLKIDLIRITKILQIENLPTPNLFSLIKRYCDELALPRGLSKVAQQVMNMFTPHMDYSKYEYRVFPDYECRAMAYILFVLKLLFSVDDVTELKQSHFADTYNEHSKNIQINDKAILFSWSSWVRYIECRKAILCKYDVTLNQLYDIGEAKTDAYVFLKHWKKNQPCTVSTDKYVFKEYTIKPLKSMTRVLREKHKESEAVNIQFPSSLTPMKTYTQYLLIKHAELLSDRCRTILSEDFSSCSIKYLLDSEWALNIGRDIQPKLNAVSNAAVEERIKFEKPISNVMTDSGSPFPAHISTPVKIIMDAKKKSRNEIPRLKNYFPTIIFLDEVAEEDLNWKPLELYFPPFNYWFFHDIHRKMNNESFNKIATDNLPCSFIWLLKECSSVVRCNLYDLYIELVTVERIYYYLYAGGNADIDIDGLCLYSNEW